MMGGDSGISAFPDGDNIFHWTGTITGGTGTVFEGLAFKLSFKFPTSYPYEAPVVTFSTPCFHPNVDQYGNICLDILKEKWSAVYNTRWPFSLTRPFFPCVPPHFSSISHRHVTRQFFPYVPPHFSSLSHRHVFWWRQDDSNLDSELVG